MAWCRNVIIQNGNLVIGVLLAGDKLETNSYIPVAGGLDDDGVKHILQEWQKGKVSGQSGDFTWREESSQ